MAPEYLIQGVVSIKADIYSLGVIIIEILTGYRNYPLSSLPHFQQLSEDNSRQITASFQYFKENVR
jgi:serine/threonine protein kinase